MSRSRSRSGSSTYAGARGERAWVHQAINLAKKGMDTDVSLTPVIATTNTNASSFVLNLVQQGNGSWNRVGRKIIPKSLRIKGVATFNQTVVVATGAQDGNELRQVVVWDKQPSAGAIPTFDAIFGITVQDGTESCPDITCPPRYDTMDRFKVVSDKTWSQGPGFYSSTGTGPLNQIVVCIDEYIKLNVGETVFSGQSAPMTIADINTGALYVFYRARNNTASATVSVDAIARLRYMN